MAEIKTPFFGAVLYPLSSTLGDCGRVRSCLLADSCCHVMFFLAFLLSLHRQVPPILLDKQFSDFTPDITPIILAAHTNNYEIIKLLVQKGVSMPQPHEVRDLSVLVVKNCSLGS